MPLFYTTIYKTMQCSDPRGRRSRAEEYFWQNLTKTKGTCVVSLIYGFVPKNLRIAAWNSFFIVLIRGLPTVSFVGSFHPATFCSSCPLFHPVNERDATCHFYKRRYTKEVALFKLKRRERKGKLGALRSVISSI